MKKLLFILFTLTLTIYSCDKGATNEAFIGTYAVTYTGTGDLANSQGTTTAFVTAGPNDDEIEIDVTFNADLEILGNSVNLPMEVNIVGSVIDDTYYIPETTIAFEFSGFPIELTFQIDGTLADNTLTSIIRMSGVATGTIDMVGVK